MSSAVWSNVTDFLLALGRVSSKESSDGALPVSWTAESEIVLGIVVWETRGAEEDAGGGLKGRFPELKIPVPTKYG